jgi:imidazoleglycerol phosphate synthase cyclase subunit
VQVVRAVRARLGIPLTVGGGVRTVEDAGALLTAGADKVSINSAAVADPDLVDGIAGRFGRQCCVVAIDAARAAGAGQESAPRWEVRVRAGTEAAAPDAVAWAAEAVGRGAGELLVTSFDRDGTGDGYDLDLLRAVCAAAPVPVIASGGARTAAHLGAALDAGAQAVLAATIFHDRHTTVRDLKRTLIEKGHPLRP